MTDVSERLYSVICIFCANCENRKCLADVPYYAVSSFCKFFAEEEIEKHGKRLPSIKRIMKKTLVETF